MAILKIIEISVRDIIKTAEEYNWPSLAIEAVDQIVCNFICTRKAQSVLLFFNKNTDALHAYRPLITEDQETFAVPSIKGTRNKSEVLGVKPYRTGRESLTKEDKNTIWRTMSGSYFWDGGKVFRISNEGDYQEIDDYINTGWMRKSLTGAIQAHTTSKDTSRKPSAKKSDAKKVASWKTDAKKVAVKKSTKKKAATKKPVAKKIVAKKSVAKKAVAKKPVKKKSATKKSKAKKTTVKKPATKKTAKAMHGGFAFGR